MSTEDARRAHQELEVRLRPYVSRRVPACDVDDVLQDIFLRLQRSLAQLPEEERFAPWLYRVARSAIVETYRQRSHQSKLARYEGLDAVFEPSNSEPNPIEQELASYVLAYIQKLPSPYREALTLTELEGLTQKAAADAMGITLSGMKSRVQRGREKLREMLEQCCRIALDARGRVIECEPRDSSDCRCRRS